MSSLDKQSLPLLDKKHSSTRVMIAYLIVTGFSGLVTVMYYIFDHGLRDEHMTFLFVPSLVMAIIFFFLAWKRIAINKNALVIMHFSFALLWFYQLLMGIYTMAKTASAWLWVFLLLSGLGWAATIVLTAVGFWMKKTKTPPENDSDNA